MPVTKSQGQYANTHVRVFGRLAFVSAIALAGCPASAPKPPPAVKPPVTVARPAPPVQPVAPAQPSPPLIAEQPEPPQAPSPEEVATRERERLHREESSVRLLLLTPAGPLVARVYVTIDGQGLRQELSQRVDELLAAADTDGDDTPTWDEAAGNEAFNVGPFAARPLEDEERQAAIERADENADGLADRSEVLALAAGDEDDPLFVLDRRQTASAARREEEQGWKLLDDDGDGLLSADELGQAERLLKLRDSDDDDLLFPDELSGVVPMGMSGVPQQMADSGGEAPQTMAILLVRRTNWSTIRYLLNERYSWGEPDEESEPLVAHLAKRLDADKDGQVRRDEFPALATIAPQLELEARFGRVEEGAPGLTLAGHALGRVDRSLEVTDLAGGVALEVSQLPLGGELQRATQVPGGVALELPGVRLRFVSTDPGPIDFAQLAATQLAALDGDKNEYLDATEFANVGAGEDIFGQVDADGDGKVFAAELTTYIEQQQGPQLKRVRATSTGQGDALFGALDASNDGRLTLREMRSAPQRLTRLDADGDGALAASEVPATLVLSFARGDGQQQPVPVAVAQPATATAPAGPEWFVRMDSNADGDLSPREFLGDADQFARLDADGDGFVSAGEAE